MQINIDYKMDEEDKGKLTYSEITENYLIQAVISVFPNGIGGQKNRIWGRIQRKIDDAILNKNDTVDLEKSEIEFLQKDVFAKDPVIHPAASKFFSILEDEVSNLGKEKSTGDVSQTAG